MPNPFVHIELNTTDHDKALAFYGSLLDWKLEDMPMPMGRYTMIGVGDGGTGGGIQKHPVPGAPSMWLPYILVDDVAASAEKAVQLGATINMGPVDIPDMGSFVILTDPTGAVVGLWQTKGD